MFSKKNIASVQSCLSSSETTGPQTVTGAEWEYACRAGTTSPFSPGDLLTSKQANFNGKYPYGGADKGPYLRQTAKVGSYAPNAFGLYDMHGNPNANGVGEDGENSRNSAHADGVAVKRVRVGDLGRVANDGGRGSKAARCPS